jgi:hypothetical protein
MNGGKVMKIQRVLVALTVLNLVLLMFLMAQIRPVTAQNIAPVLRGRALEIVDDQGRVRAEIKVHPAQPALKMPEWHNGLSGDRALAADHLERWPERQGLDDRGSIGGRAWRRKGLYAITVTDQ